MRSTLGSILLPLRPRGAARHGPIPMRRGVGITLPRSRPAGLAVLALLGICALGFASSVALAGQASLQQVTTAETTAITTTSQSTASTATQPDPKPPPPPPPPKPDPKPKKPTRITPPPPPPPPPPAPQPTAPQETTPTAAAPPPPPAGPPSSETTTPVAAAVTRPPRRTRARPSPRAQKASRRAPRAKVAPREGRRSSADIEAEWTLDRTAAPAAMVSEAATDSPVSGAFVVLIPLFALGLLLLAASAFSPAIVAWQAITEPLYRHRADLAAIGIGTIALALLCLNIAILL